MDARALEPLLIANRGEIAVRVARTARALGLCTVAVFTAEEGDAPHVDAADIAVEIASHLDPDALVGAARVTGARAVHPGYGFLSESPAFARAVLAAGLTWVGPSPRALALMGDKAAAKRLAKEAGVPVVPGLDAPDVDLGALRAFAEEHGLPLAVKALAGGGGRGMRVIRAREELEPALDAARREARAAFGDDRVLVERYLERPRHVEVQVLADRHGAVVHLGERECSLQRRHQKVVEEAPSPAVTPALREAMGEAAVALARACAYEGAGTVEFLLAGGAFSFLEMNARLQVEHPVTELVHGVDLVEQQLRIAAGEPLLPELAAGPPRGHAVEARLYAEDPARGFLPATGTVRRYREPEGVRVDSGIREGTEVGTGFDPLLAKVIAHAPDRPGALRRLDRALRDFELVGVATNAAFTRALLAREEVREGTLHTELLEDVLAGYDAAPPPDLAPAAAVAARLADTAGLTVPPGPWRRTFAGLGEARVEGDHVVVGGTRHRWAARAAPGGRLRITFDGVSRAYAAVVTAKGVWLARDGHHLAAPFAPPRGGDPDGAPGSLEAPMPGTVLLVHVADGDPVEEGQPLLVLESMKMELAIAAPHAGVVAGLALAPGDRVAVGQRLAAVLPRPDGFAS